MPHIVTLLWALLAGLRALPRRRAPRPGKTAPGLASQGTPLRAAQGHPPSRHRTPGIRPHAAPLETQEDIARAMATVMDLFARWRAGTLPPPGPHTLLAGHYRRQAAHAPHPPARALRARRLRALTRPAPARATPIRPTPIHPSPAAPPVLPAPRPRPARAAAAARPARPLPRRVPRAAIAAAPAKAPTRRTTHLFR